MSSSSLRGLLSPVDPARAHDAGRPVGTVRSFESTRPLESIRPFPSARPSPTPVPPTDTARPRMAAGALLRDYDGCVLLVRPTYKPGWDIPGGMVEPGESPAQACVREVREELGLDVHPGRLLVVDWAPHPLEGDKVLWIFDGGELPWSLSDLDLRREEIAEVRWAHAALLHRYTPDRLARRLVLAVRALERGGTVYAEHGRNLHVLPGTGTTGPGAPDAGHEPEGHRPTGIATRPAS